LAVVITLQHYSKQSVLMLETIYWPSVQYRKTGEHLHGAVLFHSCACSCKIIVCFVIEYSTVEANN